MESEKTQFLYSRFEAAELLRLSVRMLDYLVRQGKIRAVKYCRKVLFTPQALQEFITGNETRPLGQG